MTRSVSVSLVVPSARRTAPPCNGVSGRWLCLAHRKLKLGAGHNEEGPGKQMSGARLPASLAAVPQADQFEIVAAMLVEALAGDAELHRLDPGGGRAQLADFRFEGASGADLGRLEVTTTTRKKRSSFIHEVGRRSWRFRSLSWSWTVQARDSARIGELHAKIEPLLAQLERDGRTGGWIPDQPGLEPADPGALPPALARLGVLAVSAAHRHVPGGTAWVSVHPHMSSGAFSRNAAACEAQAEVNKSDNQAKLKGAGVTRSELFVWLDAGPGQAALSTLAKPPFDSALAEVPVLDLPACITAVWVAVGLDDWPRPAPVIFRCDGHSWQSLNPPVLDYDQDRVDAMLARLR